MALRYYYSLFALLILISVPGAAFAGAWTPSEGSAYQKFALNYFDSSESFDRAQDRANGFKSFTDWNLTYYGEYGLLDKLALFGSLPVKRISQKDNNGRSTTYGVGDTDVGLRYRILADPLVLSTQFLFKIPYFYEKSARLPLGNGQEDFEGRLLVGKSLGRFGYLGFEAGYRFRRSGPSDEFRYLAEYGFNATRDLYFRSKLDGILSLKNGDTESNAFGNPQLRNDFDLGKLELTAGYALTKSWAGEFTFAPNLYGRNTLKGYNLAWAAVYQF
jgi:hypothetical protein